MAVVVHSCGNSAIEVIYKVCKRSESQVSVRPGKNNEEPCVTLSNGVTVKGLLTTIKALVRFSEKDGNIESSLLGQCLLEQAEVEQWLEYCLRQITPCLNVVTEIKDQLNFFNCYMVDRVYMVGQCLTVADLFLFSALSDIYHILTFQEKEKYINVSRWFLQVQNHPSITDPPTNVRFLRNLLY